MARFECLSDESYEKLKSLHRKSLISKKDYENIEDCVNKKKIESILNNIVILDKISVSNIWMYIINHVWTWNSRERKTNKTFNELQSAFLKELISCGGMMSQMYCLKSVLTYHEVTEYLPELEEWDIIVTVKTRKSHGNKKYYLIHPQIIDKIR